MASIGGIIGKPGPSGLQATLNKEDKLKEK